MLQQTDLDRLRAKRAEAEELRCRNVIEAAGWRVTHVTTTRLGESWYAIVNKADMHSTERPPSLLAKWARHRQRQEMKQ